MDLAEIDRIVFTDNPSPRAEPADKQLKEKLEEPPKAPYTDLQETQRIKLLIDQSVDQSLIEDASKDGREAYFGDSYVEEDSYVNPSNVSKVNQSYQKLDNSYVHKDVNASALSLGIDMSFDGAARRDQPK